MKHTTWLKKLGLREIGIEMGLFDYTVICIIGDHGSLDEYIQYKFDDPDFRSEDFDKGFKPRGKCLYRPGYVPVVWIPKFPTKPREYATLAHESLHAVYHLFRWAGIEPNDQTEEVMTHAMAHIINTILENK